MHRCRWVQPAPRTLEFDNDDKQNIKCTKDCAQDRAAGGRWAPGHTPQRVVSMSIPLNTGYDGGHLYVFGEPEKQYKLKPGSVCAFTSPQVAE
jgi:hypothetical protein